MPSQGGVLLPHLPAPRISRQFVADTLILGTTAGLQKKKNEDYVGYKVAGNHTTICMADGHWGPEAAEHTVNFWMDRGLGDSKEAALHATELLENQLHDRISAKPGYQHERRSAETSFITAAITRDKLQYVAYGDCRLLVIRKGKIAHNYQPVETWLGAPSHDSKKGRLNARNGTSYAEFALAPGDLVYVFSDGIDECIYETPTIPWETMAEYSNTTTDLGALFTKIMNQVFECGAEDNASLLIARTT